MDKVRAAIYTGLALILGTFFAVWNDLVTVDAVAMVLRFLWECVVICFIVTISVIVGWSTTTFFKRLMLDPPYSGVEYKPDGTVVDHEWKRKRLMKCSGIWTGLVATGVMGIRELRSLWRQEFVDLYDAILAYAQTGLYVMVCATIAIGVSIFAFDLVVKDLMPKFKRALNPTKLVLRKSGKVEEVPADEQSPDGDKTLPIDRSKL